MSQPFSSPRTKPRAEPPVEDVSRNGRPTGIATSLFVNGQFPSRRRLIIGLSVLAGFLLSVVWSAKFVDHTIGGNVSDTLLGEDAREMSINGAVGGIVFALVTGIAGTFTACNVAAFSAMAPLSGGNHSKGSRHAHLLRPLVPLGAGALVVSALYGVLVAVVGTGMPQFQESAPAGTGILGRLLQGMVVFGLIGLIMIVLGLASLGLIRDPLARVSARYPQAPLFIMGTLIGAFLIGRPFSLFRQLFRDVAESHNVFYGAAAFSLQALGNILIMAVLFVTVGFFFGERIQQWLTAKPSRVSAVMAAAFISAGAFMVLYWDVRLPSRLDYYWYPVAPWV